MAQFWGWLEDVFVPAIFSDGSYRDQEEKGLDYTSSDRSTVVGMPRLRQLRVTKGKHIPGLGGHTRMTMTTYFVVFSSTKEDLFLRFQLLLGCLLRAPL